MEEQAVAEQAVIDRIEDGQHAVLLVGEEEREQIVPVAALPPESKPGSWLRVRFEGARLVSATVDLEETERTRQRISDKLDRVRQRGRNASS